MHIKRQKHLKLVQRLLTLDVPEQKQGPPPGFNSWLFGGGKLETHLLSRVVDVAALRAKDDDFAGIANVRMMRESLCSYSFLMDLMPPTNDGEGDLVLLGVEEVLATGLEVRGVRDNLVAKTDLYLSVEWG